ncbi:MAG TPA: hypothetical protein VGG96_09105, partial [Steroidobacteraceae bacterium]
MRADPTSGVSVTEHDGRGIARIEPRRGSTAEVMGLLHANFGIAPPDGPRRVSRDDVAIGGIGPNSWVAIH